MCAGLAELSAITSTSEGPAGISIAIIASLFDSSIFAAVTYWLPGPKILSTCGQHEETLRLLQQAHPARQTLKHNGGSLEASVSGNHSDPTATIAFHHLGQMMCELALPQGEPIFMQTRA